MHGQEFFLQAFIYLSAAVVAVPIAKRLGLGSVIGYLVAGMVIGPYGLAPVGEEGQDVMHFAEFGRPSEELPAAGGEAPAGTRVRSSRGNREAY